MGLVRLYILQSWTIIRQNRLFSGIYIAGTGLSIALAMTLFIVLYVNIASIYPEYNRDRTLVISEVFRVPKDTTNKKDVWGNRASYYMLKMMKGLSHLESACAVKKYNGFMDKPKIVMNPNTKTEVECTPLGVDGGYWSVFGFEFLSGKPFNQNDVTSFSKTLVLSQSLAKQLFATDRVVGKTVNVDNIPYVVCGVVKDVPASMSSYVTSDMWLPFDNEDDLNAVGSNGLMGDITVLLTAKSSGVVDALCEEAMDNINKYSEQDKVYNYIIPDRPVVMSEAIFSGSYISGIADGLIYILLALLIIPAMNLSGLISSKMSDRRSELGIRKSYGATNSMLLSQVFWENLLLTFIGGVLGLILCFIIVVSADSWITSILSESNSKPPVLSGNITTGMLFNLPVFCCTLLFCVVLNVVSAIIPAALALRCSIINSLNSKK